MTEPSEERAAFTIAKAMAQSTATVSLPTNEAEPLPPATTKPLRPPRRRSFVMPVMAVGFTALFSAIGINRLEPVEQPKPQPQIEASDSVRPELYEDGLNKLRSSFDESSRKQPAKPVNPFKSYALDVAQLYLAIASFPKAKGK
jgi:hypothetical protein